MKRTMSFLLAGLLTVSLAACGNAKEPQVSEQETEILAEEEDNGQAEDADAAGDSAGSRMLVAYFSYGENANLPKGVDASSSASIQAWNGETTGNTGLAARMIREAAGADLFSIQTAEKYPDSYDATLAQGQEEKSGNARPKLATHIENLDDYDVVALGFPNWWGDMPMAMYTFLEEYDLSGKTIIPFVTSGGSGFSSTIDAIKNIQPGAEVQEGLSIRDSDAANAQSQIEEWLTGLGYLL